MFSSLSKLIFGEGSSNQNQYEEESRHSTGISSTSDTVMSLVKEEQDGDWVVLCNGNEPGKAYIELPVSTLSWKLQIYYLTPSMIDM